MKIWQRYIFRQVAFTFIFMLFCLFTVYVLIDLSIHGVKFQNAKGMELLVYYLRQFATHLDLFSPLAFLLSTLKVLFSLSSHMEITALQMAGLSRKKILLPFFFLATLLSLLGVANHEYFGDNGVETKHFKKAHARKKRSHHSIELQTLTLEDGSELVYHKFDGEKLLDVFWIRSEKDFWHIKSLSTTKVGTFADHFIRDKLVEKQESFPEMVFTEMPLKEIVEKPFVPYENRPLSTLFSENSAESRTHFHHQLAIPLLPFFILLLAAPSALRFSRRRPLFLVTALALFGFVTLMTLFDSLVILGENRVLPPWQAMWILPTGLLLFSFRHFRMSL